MFGPWPAGYYWIGIAAVSVLSALAIVGFAAHDWWVKRP